MGSAHMPKRALIGALLIANMLTATRLSFSIQPLVRRSSYSLICPKHFPKSRPCPLWSSSFSFCLQNPHRSPTCPSIVPFSSHCSAPSMATVPQSTPEVNPLLLDFDFPPFDAVKADHVIPGIRTMLNQLENDLIELESKVEPTWPKLVDPLEKLVDRLSVVWGIVNHLKSVKDSSELRSAIEEVQPDKVKFELRLGQSKPIYNAFKAIQESPEWQTLSDAQKRIVDSQIKQAVLSGVSLEDDKKEHFNKIQQELEKLSQKFEENVLDATKKFGKLITDKKDIEGLPATALGLAAQTAVSKGHKDATAENGPWIITLDGPSFLSVMQHAQNRSLRKEVYYAYVTRASSGDLDNTEIIGQILKLRLEKAKLLGYSNYAEVSMATKMATVDKAEELLEKLRSASWDAAVQDTEDLKNFSKSQGAVEADDLSHWDLNFWSERLRESKYDINEEELRPYFSLPKVMGGLFSLAKMLFGIDIEPADGLAPVWNNDVRFYCVKDTAGSPIAYFYFDPYSRPSEKRGGAWMDEVVARSRALSRDGTKARLPIAHMVCNQTPPVGNKPSLMTFREVETVFHEFGHALQHMLTKQDEGLVSGIRGIEWDAVELPSQFMENWCYHRDTLMSIAKHYETGETLPEDVYLKLVAARTFRAGSLSLRQIRFATVDLELHSKYVPGGSETIYDVDQRVSKGTQVIPPLPEDRFLCSFSHIFAGGYAAGYYSYKWAEVLSADAFSAFEDAGLDDEKAVEETGKKFRETVLALGGGKAPLEVFVEFRGREPSPEALLRHNGLLSVTASA
ncbi:probable cytosolic oligopeptidase A isoform X2 [Vitis vinifera]|uniref:probable cytosolic oligopeptidase A isoform X2 n=1 Tax=Vitis vinifera TaxID=29760 RepID=UPI0028834DA1|nr:probable cytosolic oligopeptidase A isoform X2 [Vitis vinifera]